MARIGESGAWCAECGAEILALALHRVAGRWVCDRCHRCEVCAAPLVGLGATWIHEGRVVCAGCFAALDRRAGSC